MNWIAILTPAIPSIIAAVIVYRVNKKADSRYNEAQKQHEERVKAERLSMEMQLATADLSYATAMAIKRGKANGEVVQNRNGGGCALHHCTAGRCPV